MLLRLLICAVALCAIVPVAPAQLTALDVERVIKQGATRATRISPNSVIAVVDREGYVLGVWNVRGGEPTSGEIAAAVSKAGTGAFLSSNANAFSTRTAGFIIQEHFPPGVRNTAPGPLVGVGFSNLPFSDVNRFKQFLGPLPLPQAGVSPGTLGVPIPGTSLAGSPGGLPLYKNGRLVGGVGVTGDGSEGFVVDYDRDEDVALAAQKGFLPASEITADNVFINGISLAYVESGTASSSTLILRGNAAAGFPIQGSPAAFPYPVATFAGVEGQIRQPIIGDPIAGTINGEPRLSAAEVTRIIEDAADRVRTTRAGIRLPIGTRMEVFITVVNNPNTPGVSPAVLGTFRTGDATIFSWDVAVQKARTAVGFSTNATAFSTRTVGFLAQTHYPPGIDPESPGPFFGLQERFSTPPPDARFPNGITIFPGGFPLYRNGQLIGAIGISGDGVDQDDIVGASGTEAFPAPFAVRADRFEFDDTRLPYAKFPRDPEGVSQITPVVLPAIAASAAPVLDLGGDGKTDLIWQNNRTGERAIWLMDGTSMVGERFLPTIATDWEIAGVGDFSGDGKADLLWQNARTGERAIWLMDRVSWIGEHFLPTIAREWEIAATGDFSGDGKADLVWQNHTTGERAIWLMDGTKPAAERFLPTVSTVWMIAAAADFDGDGKADLVWQNNTTGERAIWLMDGTAQVGEHWLPTIPTEWQIAGAGDFSGDGKADLIWQNDRTGERAIWFMDGTMPAGERFLPTIPVEWEIRN